MTYIVSPTDVTHPQITDNAAQANEELRLLKIYIANTLTTINATLSGGTVHTAPNISWEGTWNPILGYVLNDAVVYQGSTYICTVTHPAPQTPTNVSYWDLMIQGPAIGNTIKSQATDIAIKEVADITRLAIDATGLATLPGSASPAAHSNDKTIVTTDYLNTVAQFGGFTKVQMRSGKTVQGRAVIINNRRIYITGLAASFIGKSSSVPHKTFKEVPFADPSIIPAGTTIVDAYIVGRSMWVVLSNGWVYSWGANTSGQLGHGDLVDRKVLTRIEYFVTNSISVTKVWASATVYQGGVSLQGTAWFGASNGNLYGAGRAVEGQLGDGTIVDKTTPVVISGITNVVQLSASGGIHGHVLAVSSNNLKQVYGWGYNANGQVGDATLVQKTSPAVRYTDPTYDITQVMAIAGDYHNGTAWVIATGASYILAGGLLYATGANASGQLGMGNTTQLTSFTAVPGISNVTKIDYTCANFGTVVALSGGRIYAVGHNASGQVGDGTVIQKNSFTLVTTFAANTIVDIVAGGYSALGIVAAKHVNGNVYTCGADGVGALGRGDMALAAANSTYGIVPLPMGISVESIGISYAISAVRSDAATYINTSDGGLYTCGINASGALSILEDSLGTAQSCAVPSFLA
jgi:alpha-tubulin suppressor-like RCC1 family protein